MGTLPFERPVLETPEHPAQELPYFEAEERRRARRASRSCALPCLLQREYRVMLAETVPARISPGEVEPCLLSVHGFA